MQIIQGSELRKLCSLHVYYGNDNVRQMLHIVSINGFLVHDVFGMTIEDGFLSVNNCRGEEMSRILLNDVNKIIIDREFGEYSFITKRGISFHKNKSFYV